MCTEPSFAVIITTYQRPQPVLRALASVQAQSHPQWHCYIVVDDVQNDYSELFGAATEDQRVTVLKNERNIGKNASVNRVLRTLAEASFDGYVVFLDDDDWLAADCLSDFAAAIKRSESPWLVSNRTDAATKEPITRNPCDLQSIRYYADMLFWRRFWGDATHCLHFPTVCDIRFPTRIKNAEEWLYFASVANVSPRFVFVPGYGTYTDGYAAGGLTHARPPLQERCQRFGAIVREMRSRALTNGYALAYLCGRLIKLPFS